MEEDKFEHLIIAGSRENCDSADMEEMYHWVTEAISDHQTSYKSAAVAAALHQKFKFYERDGKKSTRRYLLSLGYSKGTISHLLKYGNFIILMGFAPHQIPPESVVRAILTNKNENLWQTLYTTACQKHYFAAKSARDLPRANVGSAASRTAGARNTEAASSIANECEGDEEEKEENSAVMVDGANLSDRDEASAEDEAGPPGVDPQDQVTPNPIWDHVPTGAEIRAVLDEYRRNDPDYIHLPHIGETMSRQETFSGALEKFKEKLSSVATLCHTVQDFRDAGGTLSRADADAITQFCAVIHKREDERLKSAISGESAADDSSDPVEEAADDDGEEK